MQCEDEESAKAQFYTSLERTGAGYFDYYLLHALMENNYKKYDDYHIWDFAKELRKKGLIRNYGFSFHSDHRLLDQLLTEHPDVDFVQLQINYADWDNPNVEARANYEVARGHGKLITVMEPVKGGALADPIPAVKEVFDRADRELAGFGPHPGASCASWAIRYVASLGGIISVLSGMSDLAQMRDNLSYMKDFTPLSDAEQAVIREVNATMDAVDSIPCTACHYCTDGCPKKIPIPEIFSARNDQLIFNQIEKGKERYQKACPQHLGIIEYLRDAAANLEAE